MKIFWTATAIHHLEKIFDYYSLKASKITAKKIVSSIAEKTILLEKTQK